MENPVSNPTKKQDEPRPDPENTVMFLIDYETLATQITNGAGKELRIEGEIDRDNDKGMPCITINLKVYLKN